jgi:uncharacterized protein DUF1579
MKRRAIMAAALSLAVSGAALAQSAGEAPKPTAEHKKLGYFVGKWTTEGEMKPNPFGPGGKVTATDNCEWFEGGFSVVCKSEGKSPAGPTKGLGIMSYNTDEKAYTYYGVDNSPMSMASVPHGTVQDDTWTYNDEAKMGGKMVKSRYVIKQGTPTSYTFKWEMQGDDGTWKPILEGKSTKTP